MKFRPAASPIRANATILKSFSLRLQTHSGIIVRQAIPRSSGSNRKPICRIKTEKPDAASARTPHIGTHVQFLESQPDKARESVRTDAAHAERNDTDPSRAIESIELQIRRNQWADQVGTDRPMQKQYIMPTHGHNPGSRWRRPRSEERRVGHE